jgi:hypothetical protein
MDTSSTDRLLDTIVDDMAYAAAIVDDLHQRGYDSNFELIGNKLVCLQSQQHYSPRDFWVDEIYRFDHDNIGLRGYFVYALREPVHHVMGIFIARIVEDFRL